MTAIPKGWRIERCPGGEIGITSPIGKGPGGLTLNANIDEKPLATRMLHALCEALLEAQADAHMQRIEAERQPAKPALPPGWVVRRAKGVASIGTPGEPGSTPIDGVEVHIPDGVKTLVVRVADIPRANVLQKECWEFAVYQMAELLMKLTDPEPGKVLTPDHRHNFGADAGETGPAPDDAVDLAAAKVVAEHPGTTFAARHVIQGLVAEVERSRAPIDMVLHCPACGLQHVDAEEHDHPEGWDNPPHRSHLCRNCGHIWRPADVPTNGVQELKTKGKADSPIPMGPRVLFVSASKLGKSDALEALKAAVQKPPMRPLFAGLPTMHGLAGKVRMVNDHGAVVWASPDEPAVGQVWRFTIGDAINVSKAELLDVTPGTVKLRHIGAYDRTERLRRDRIHFIERVPAEECPF